MLSGINLIKSRFKTMVTFFVDAFPDEVDEKTHAKTTSRIRLYIIHGFTSEVDRVLGEHTKKK